MVKLKLWARALTQKNIRFYLFIKVLRNGFSLRDVAADTDAADGHGEVIVESKTRFEVIKSL